MVFPGLEGCKSAPFHVSFRQDLCLEQSLSVVICSPPYFFLFFPLWATGGGDVRGQGSGAQVGGRAESYSQSTRGFTEGQTVGCPSLAQKQIHLRVEMASGRQSWAVSSPQWVSSCNMGTACVGMRSLGSSRFQASSGVSGCFWEE